MILDHPTSVLFQHSSLNVLYWFHGMALDGSTPITWFPLSVPPFHLRYAPASLRARLRLGIGTPTFQGSPHLATPVS